MSSKIREQEDIIAKIKTDSIESLKSSTTHGLSKLLQRDKIVLKLFWLFLILFSSSVAIALILKNVLDFLEYNVNTEVRLLDPSILEFPVVTICSKNKFSSAYAYEFFNRKLNEISTIRNSDKKNDSSFIQDEPINSTIYQLMLDFDKNSSNEIFRDGYMTNIKDFTLSIEDMLLTCKFDDKKCLSSDFSWIFNEVYGNCYRFNSNSSNTRTIKRAKKSFGLILDLNVGIKFSLNDFDVNMFDKGVYISIDPPEKNPFNDFDNVIYIPDQYEANILLQRSEFIKYPSPYSNCELQSTKQLYSNKFYQQMIKAGYLYSQDLCIEYCKNFELVNICNCTYLYSSIEIESIKICNQSETVDCVWNNKFNSTNSWLNDICIEQCPLECKKIKYDSFITSYKYPSIEIEMLDLDKYNVSNDNVLRINIYYGSLSYLNYKESQSISVIGLVSNIGGTLGLFLGMSVLSFAEFLEIIFNSFWTFYVHKKRNNLVDPKKIVVRSRNDLLKH